MIQKNLTYNNHFIPEPMRSFFSEYPGPNLFKEKLVRCRKESFICSNENFSVANRANPSLYKYIVRGR